MTSSPAGIDCGSKCTALFEEGTVVTLSATPGEREYFAGWEGGGCTGTGSCTFAVDHDMGVIARFSRKPLQFIRLRPSDTHVSPGDRVKVRARIRRCEEGQTVTLAGGGKSRTRRANPRCKATFGMRLTRTTRFWAKVSATEDYFGSYSDRVKIRVSTKA